MKTTKQIQERIDVLQIKQREWNNLIEATSLEAERNALLWVLKDNTNN